MHSVDPVTPRPNQAPGPAGHASEPSDRWQAMPQAMPQASPRSRSQDLSESCYYQQDLFTNRHNTSDEEADTEQGIYTSGKRV